MNIDLSSFKLNHKQLEEIRDTLSDRIKIGLQKDNTEIKAMPAFLPSPPKGLDGEVLVLDTGGTNMRAAVVKINADGTESIVKGPVHDTVPSGRDGKAVSAEEFFGAQAKLAASLEPARGLNVGYCFSYPAKSTPDTDAILLNWTKNINVTGVEGTLVGEGLKKALEKAGLAPKKVTVLNDTVAALLAGAGKRAGDFDGFIGLIAGTGTNMAGFVPTSACEKTAHIPWSYKEMAVNLESGNFFPPHLTKWDDALNDHLDNPGAQRFEKAVSGYYLPFVYKEIYPEKDFDPALGTAELHKMNDDASKLIVSRSADLTACGLAGFIKAACPSSCGIIAEGSLYWKSAGYHEHVCRVLAELVPNRFEIFRLADANLIGSAYAALI